MANVWDAMRKHEAEQARLNNATPPPAQPAPAPEDLSPAAPEDEAPDAEESLAHGGPAVAVETPEAPRKAEATGVVQTAMAQATQSSPPAVTPLSDYRKGASYSELLMAHHDRGGPVTEEYRALRTSLLAQNPSERFCYLITSANAGEGKSISAANLALVMAERIDRRTVLIDCDLRKHALAGYLGTSNTPGVSELLTGKVTLREAIQTTAYPNLFFLPAGDCGDCEPGELIGRPELEEVVAELRRKYDYVLFDTPPINVVSDAGMLGRATGEALLVVRMHKTHRESVDKAIRLLHAANVKPAGLVLTHRRFLIPNYLYRYS